MSKAPNIASRHSSGTVLGISAYYHDGGAGQAKPAQLPADLIKQQQLFGKPPPRP